MVAAVKRGFPQREIADAAYRCSTRSTAASRILVGVNDFTEGGDGELELQRIDPALERKQIDRLQAVRARRDGAAVERSLAALRRPPRSDGEPDADAARLRARTRHRRRDRREPSAGLG